MAKFLDWYALHNTVIIQALAALIALLIVFFIFRLFFAKSSVDAHENESTGYSQINEKLNKLLDNQTHAVPVSLDVNSEQDVLKQKEIINLQNEMAALKAQITEKDKELQDVKAAILAAGDSPVVENAESLQKELETLKERLSEYEIIADDIADLQKLRKENEDLKRQMDAIAMLDSDPEVAAPEVNIDDLQNELKNEEVQISEEVVMDKAPEDSPIEAVTTATGIEEDILPDPLAPTELDTTEAKEMSQNVSQSEKDMLDEFEKNFSKSED